MQFEKMFVCSKNLTFRFEMSFYCSLIRRQNPAICATRFSSRTINTRKPKVKKHDRRVLEKLASLDQPQEPKPLWENCSLRGANERAQSVSIHPLEQLYIQEIQDELTKCKLAVVYFNMNMPDDDADFYYYKFRNSGFKFMRRSSRVFHLALKNTKWENMKYLLSSEQPILATGEVSDMKSLLSLTKGDPYVIPVGGLFEDRLVTSEKLTEITKLNMEKLRIDLVGTLQSPMSTLVHSLQQQQFELSQHLQNLVKLKSEN